MSNPRVNPSQVPCVLMWFRHDLRISDHPTLLTAASEAKRAGARLLCLWFFEERMLKRDTFGNIRTGRHRLNFLLQSVLALSNELNSLGQTLITLRGDPVTGILNMLSGPLQIISVHASSHVTTEEVQQEQALERRLKEHRIPLILEWTHTLMRREQLPTTIDQIPDIFTHFRKLVEGRVAIDEPLPSPHSLPPPPQADQLSLWIDQLPGLRQQDQRTEERDPRAVIDFQGGAAHGLQRLEHYFWSSRKIETYRETRNGFLHADESTKFSPWLSVGALSPKRIWSETLRYERARVANQSTYWVRFELLWREYFQWVALKFGADIFKIDGLCRALGRTPPQRGSQALDLLIAWSSSKTGDRFVDAHMRELKETGWMSNRGRQNVASYLIHDLGLDWRMGAQYFEAHLLDYDPAVNWGNWAYIAGVGNDPRPLRRFNTLDQALRYDPEGRYQDKWSE